MDLIESVYKKKIEELFQMTLSFQKVGRIGYHPGLETMLDFASLLNNPHLEFKSVHIAGTNGKGSVAHLLASVLAVSSPGLKVGLYTSPHLTDFRERIKIVEAGVKNGEDEVGSSVQGYRTEEQIKTGNKQIKSGGRSFFSEIGKSDVLSFLDRSAEFIKSRKPSFFEITTAMAFDYFARSKVDLAIIETGLGGRLDSTNIITPMLSIITSIGLDHTDILGNTIPDIAFEKGGIVKPQIPVIVGNLPQEALGVISGIASKRGSELIEAASCRSEYLSAINSAGMDLKSESQGINVRCVLEAYSILAGKGYVPAVPVVDAISHAAEYTGLRGRWEKLSSSPTVICDIGHNFEALSVSMAQLEKEAAGRRLFMILGMCGDKDVRAVRTLFPANAVYCFTQAQGARAMPSERLGEIVDDSRRKRGAAREFLNSFVTSSVKEAVEFVMGKAAPEDFVFIGGSAFVAAEAIPLFDPQV